MTSELLNRWGIPPGTTKEVRSERVSEAKKRFLYPESVDKLFDLLRDNEFSKIASPAILTAIERVCESNQVTLVDLFILNDFELSKLDKWDENFTAVITAAADRFRVVNRDSS